MMDVPDSPLFDATLAQTMECPVELLQQFIDVFVGALHRRQAGPVLAREGFGARPEERDEKIFADERPQGRGAATHELGQVSNPPGRFGQLASPAFVQRQQSLTDGRINRSGRGAVVEEVKFGDFTLVVCLFRSTIKGSGPSFRKKPARDSLLPSIVVLAVPVPR